MRDGHRVRRGRRAGRRHRGRGRLLGRRGRGTGLTPADDRPHRPGPEPDWEESWWFDFAAADGSLAGFVRLGLWPGRASAWYWAALVGDDRRYLLVRDDDVPLPKAGRTDVRAEALWSALECETPFEHWTVGLEAFGVALDDPADAWTGERGDRVGLGFDLEWEATDPAGDRQACQARQACRVSGEILVGPSERFTFDGPGQRAHRWGPADLPQAAPPPPPPPTPTAASASASASPRHRAPILAGGRRFTFAVVARGGDFGWVTT